MSNRARRLLVTAPPPRRRVQALDLRKRASLNRFHEHVPLGGRDLPKVARLANADLVVIDFDARARIARRAERETLLRHHCVTSLRMDFSGAHAEQGAACLTRVIESDAATSSPAPTYVTGFESKTNLPTTTITDAATLTARRVRGSAREPNATRGAVPEAARHRRRGRRG